MARRENISIAVLLILFVVSTLLLVGSFESRLANSNGDDHPVVWARYFTHPELWASDGNLAGAQAFGKASLPNLLAIVGAKSNENAPVILSWIYVLIQNVGLGLSVFLLANHVARDAWISVVISLLTFAMEPWSLNLAYYPNMIHSPYPGHLVMPFLVSAIYLLVGKKYWVMTLFLSVAGLVHPSQTLQLVLLSMLYLWFENPRRETLSKIVYFILPIMTSLAIPTLFVPKFSNPLTDLELLPSALLNPHLVPWKNTTFWPWGLPSIVGIFSLSALECLPFSRGKSELKSFWWANLAALVILGAFHVFGAYFKILPIILLCPFRVSVINSVLLAPIGFYYLLKKIRSLDLGSSWASSTLLMLLLVSKQGLFWGPILILLLGDLSRQNPKIKKHTIALTLLWWFCFLFAGKPIRDLFGPDVSSYIRWFLSPGYSLGVNEIGFILVLSLLMAFLGFYYQSKNRNFTNLLLVGAALFTIFQSLSIGRQALSGDLKARWDLQIWASKSTPKESVFLIESGSWRGVADRQVHSIGYRENQILGYFRFREAKESEDKIKSLYKQVSARNFNEISDSGFMVFAKEFKGTHLIEKIGQPKRSFPVCFENERWRVYLLPSRS